MIFVTNHNDFDHQDFYDGTEYRFPAGESVEVDEAAASHMLGFGKANKEETLIRLGWANEFDGKRGWVKSETGVKKLANFVFETARLVRTPIKEQAVEA